MAILSFKPLANSILLTVKKNECVSPGLHTHMHTVRTQNTKPAYARVLSSQIDCSQQEVLHGWRFSFLFSSWQTYQPSSGGAPSACAHLKTHTNTHSHTLTHSLYKYTHAQGTNSIKCLSFKFHFWCPWLCLSLAPPDHITASCSPTSLCLLALCVQSAVLPTTSDCPSFYFLAVPCEHTQQSPHLPNNHSYCAPHCAEPTLSNAADGWAAHARHNQTFWHAQLYIYIKNEKYKKIWTATHNVFWIYLHGNKSESGLIPFHKQYAVIK